MYTLEIGPDKVKYTVPEAFLEKFPGLLGFKSSSLRNPIKLHWVYPEVGHTIVHYLYTGSYQLLKANCTHSLSHYRIAVLSYCMAKIYRVVGLDDLAKHAIWENSSGVSIYTKLNIALEFYDDALPEEVWYAEHLEREVEAAFELDTGLFTNPQFSERFGTHGSLDKVLLKIITELYSRKLQEQVPNASPRSDQYHKCTACGL
jgi:hypothetical protein